MQEYIKSTITGNESFSERIIKLKKTIKQIKNYKLLDTESIQQVVEDEAIQKFCFESLRDCLAGISESNLSSKLSILEERAITLIQYNLLTKKRANAIIKDLIGRKIL